MLVVHYVVLLIPQHLKCPGTYGHYVETAGHPVKDKVLGYIYYELDKFCPPAGASWKSASTTCSSTIVGNTTTPTDTTQSGTGGTLAPQYSAELESSGYFKYVEQFDNKRESLGSTEPVTIDAGVKYIQTWTLKNAGSSTWNTSFKLKYAGTGNCRSALGKDEKISRGGINEISPNEKEDAAKGALYTFEVVLTAPSAEGVYQECWRLYDDKDIQVTKNGVYTYIKVISSPTDTTQNGTGSATGGTTSTGNITTSIGVTTSPTGNEKSCVPVDKFQDVTIDTVGENYFNAIEALRNECIISGDSGKNTFRPNYNINRAEFTKIVIGERVTIGEITLSSRVKLPALTLDGNAVSKIPESCDGDDRLSKSNPFEDVPNNEWYCPYAVIAKKNGIVDGYSDNTFMPGKNINRPEAIKVIHEAFLGEPDTLNATKNVTSQDKEWWAKYFRNEKIKKCSGSVFEAPSELLNTPSAELKRGEMAQLIYCVMKEAELIK